MADAARTVHGLTIDPRTPPGICCVCRLEPVGQRLELTLTAKPSGDTVDVTVCRHCVSEYAPELLLTAPDPSA